MGCDIMTVKCPMCVGVTGEFGEWVGDHAEDFEHRYCYLAPTREMVEHLRQVAQTAGFDGDRRVATTLLDEMGYQVDSDELPAEDAEVGDGVAAEILIGW